MKLCINCRHYGELTGALQVPCKRNGYSVDWNRSAGGSCGPDAVFWQRAPLQGQPSAEHLAFLARFRERGWLFLEREDPAEAAAVQSALRFRYLQRIKGEAHLTPRGYAALRRQATKPSSDGPEIRP